MRCLVTGAAGFLGSHLLSLLLRRGSTVTVLLRPGSDLRRIRHLLTQTQIISGDLTQVAEVKDSIIAAEPDVVFHLAWKGGSNGRYQNDLTQVEDNLSGALNLLQIASQAGARRWIGIGSGFEYGNVNGSVAEDAFPQPNTLYAISKYSLCLTSAKMCALLGMDYIWVRPFATYGTGDNPYGLLPSVTKALLRRERPALTAGEQNWDYLYVEDAVRALLHLATLPNGQGIYNLASGTGQTLRSLVECLRDLIDPELPLGFGEIPYHPDQIMNLRADISKLTAVNWAPEITLKEGLKRIVEDQRRD